MTVPLVIVGAGGFGREVLDVIDAINCADDVPVYEILGVIDSGPSETNLNRLANRGIRFLGSELDARHMVRGLQFVVGVGSPSARRLIAARFATLGVPAATLVHPSSGLGSDLNIGAGSVICAGVQVSTNVTLGEHVHLNANATVGHDSSIGDFASVNPGAIVSGDVQIGMSSLLGAGSVVLQGIFVARNVIVGAAACVTRNIDQGTTVVGVPAREAPTKKA
ncbi:acetyltransferase [Cryobacterium sp. Y50]|uniref:acetyltransferase n=1 Tax=Cryobacterium sp. Y50 TaxID=2048286 RepID=UPI000CE4221C|nr:acetyltransferase [Cryobacterium sp. Y50]